MPLSVTSVCGRGAKNPGQTLVTIVCPRFFVAIPTFSLVVGTNGTYFSIAPNLKKKKNYNMLLGKLLDVYKK